MRYRCKVLSPLTMEIAMAVLKSLAFTALPQSVNDPVLHRRGTISRLEEQLQLLKDPNHVRTVQRWTVVDGEKRQTTKEQTIRPWWKIDPSGHVFMCIKSGSKAVEFEKGKSAIAVPSTEQLPKVIETLIAAVRSGELDASSRPRQQDRSAEAAPYSVSLREGAGESVVPLS
jgi:hypothetical protein